MKNIIYLCFLLLLISQACGPKDIPVAKPKLVVFLSIDQMRYDYPEKFADEMTEGFALLAKEGVHFETARHLHAFAGTSHGHAALSTGRYPANNGITDNWLYSSKDKKDHYSVEDTNAILVGHEILSSNTVSPAKLKSPTLGDIFKEMDPQSKVYSIALKDRSSILLAGKNSDMAFWLNPASGTFISSNWYGDTIPGWIEHVNGASIYASEMASGWTYSASLPYDLSLDSNFHEQDVFSDVFPHTLEQIDSSSEHKESDFLFNSPYGDILTLETAMSLIQHENLGKDEHVDLLNISCSSFVRMSL